ncbi:MAG: SpoIIIAH-like family protein [Clostridia bacterium]|nr:SpoIIIAH-like family protein [Clostridia bacterium]
MKKLSLDEQTMEQARRMIVAITGVVVLVALGFALKPVITSRAQQELARITGNQTAQQAEDEEPAYVSAAESIATFQDERSRNRTVTVAQLNSIIEDEKTDEQTRREAQQSLMSSIERSEQETAIEGLVNALGFESCVASVGSDTCTVVVKTPSLTRQQAAQILDVACRETGMLSGSIKVIPVE